MEKISLNYKERKDDCLDNDKLEGKKEENIKKQEEISKETKKLIEDSNKRIELLRHKKDKYIKLVEKISRVQKNKENEFISKIIALGKEIGAPLAFKFQKGDSKIKGETEKEKKYLSLIKNYENYLISQEKLYSSTRKEIYILDRQIKEINKKCVAFNKNLQKKNYELKKEKKTFNKEINSLENKVISLKQIKPKETTLLLQNSLEESPSTNVGAKMPYERYDSEEASLGGGAVLVTSPNHSQDNIASQASKQCYIKLPENGSYAEWTMHSTGKGVTMRFTMPDTDDGMGQNGSLDVYVNGIKVKTVNLTSYYMWQYFPGGNPSDSPGGAANFAFDEVHFLLDTSLTLGNKIRIQSSGANGLEYGVDFLEIEEVGDPIPQPDNSLSVTEFGAVPDDGDDDYLAITACISAADQEGKNVYFPPGTYYINQIWRVNCENMKITGAGIWYTRIQFTNDQPGTGGISGGVTNDGYCKNVEFCNMYINSNLRSRYNQQAVYKCFMDVWANGSIIHDIWEEHFECGFWIADYNGELNYSDGLKIVNCRIRNNLADGVNFCQGTSKATVYNCSIRNNGDDGLAMWNDSTFGAKDESNNVFCYNTIEFIWRAGGIAVYGGNGHKIYNNYIRDTHMSAGIHLNTIFNGHKFSNNEGIEFSNNILIKTGSVKGSWGEEFGAIDMDGNIKNITFNNTYIYDAQHDGIHFGNQISNIVFNNIKIYGTGTDGQEGNYSSVFHKGAAIQCYGTVQSVTINDITVANIASKGTMYGSTPVDNYINITNISINDEKDLDKIEYNYPGLPRSGSINTSQHDGDIDIPGPQEILDSLTSGKSQTTKKMLKTGVKDIYEKKKVIHPGIICDGCNGPIIGVRYKCVVCKDFDYCEKCEEKFNLKHGHPLLKIRTPEMCPISIKCFLNNKK